MKTIQIGHVNFNAALVAAKTKDAFLKSAERAQLETAYPDKVKCDKVMSDGWDAAKAMMSADEGVLIFDDVQPDPATKKDEKKK